MYKSELREISKSEKNERSDQIRQIEKFASEYWQAKWLGGHSIMRFSKSKKNIDI